MVSGELDVLSIRARNCLLNAGFRTKAQVKEYVDAGGADTLLLIDGFGRKSLNEVKAWLGTEHQPERKAPLPPTGQKPIRMVANVVELWRSNHLTAADAMRIVAGITDRS